MSDMDLPLAVRMMQDGYLMEIDKLQAENEELRKELAVTNPLFETLNSANDRLIFENMKLRELARDMWNWLAPTAVGGGAPLQGIVARMRELGVEV